MINILEAFQKIDTFIFDVDGVMTDGSILLLENGDMARLMNAKDGYAIQLAVKKGYHFYVVSGGGKSAVQERLNKLGVTNVYFSITDKKTFVQKLIDDNRLATSQILFMGDDIPDLPVFDITGISCCPADAVGELIHAAQYVSPVPGGRGCVRDVIEKVMKCRGDWGIDTTITSK